MYTIYSYACYLKVRFCDHFGTNVLNFLFLHGRKIIGVVNIDILQYYNANVIQVNSIYNRHQKIEVKFGFENYCFPFVFSFRM